MSSLIKDRKDADKVGMALKAMGWTPAIGTVSMNGGVKGYSLGILVKVGDERLQWLETERNPIIDFFSIANIAAGMNRSMARRPVGFKWQIAGPESVMIQPNDREPASKFIERLKSLPPPPPPMQPKLEVSGQFGFDFGPEDNLLPLAKPARAGMRP